MDNKPTNTTDKYRHYKGNQYEVIGIGKHTETMEDMVIYRSLGDPEEIWLRPYDMFFETVTINGKEIPRFKKLED